MLEFDIKGLFDHIRHDLLMIAVRKHTDIPWVCLYIERWLTVPIVTENGDSQARTKGTPQGGVISPVLANLFLHYVFDKWMQKHYSELKGCRYADDGLVHCHSEAEAKQVLQSLKQHFESCGLELHPDKTRLAYCKDGERREQYPHIQFDFLGYTFRPRLVKNRYKNSLFMSFTPAVSKAAQKAMRFKIRQLKIRMRTDLNIAQLAGWLNPIIQGWLNYYGHCRRSELYKVFRPLNKALVRWARRKYKALRKYKTRASVFIERIATNNPGLFAHWRAGMVGAFA